MKKLKLFFTLIVLLAFPLMANAWTVSWDDTTGEDGYILKYKDYPAGYDYNNQAPASLIEDMSSANIVVLGTDISEYDFQSGTFTIDNRYVFFIQATFQGSIVGNSDYLCWTCPKQSDVIELEPQSGANITINIYQKP